MRNLRKSAAILFTVAMAAMMLVVPEEGAQAAELQENSVSYSTENTTATQWTDSNTTEEKQPGIAQTTEKEQKGHIYKKKGKSYYKYEDGKLAKKIMQANTKTTDSKQKKLKKVFNWVLKHPYKRYRTLKSVQSEKGWEITFANDVYKKGQGCCVSEASAFAFLAHECGYKNVYICDDTGHAWTEINGRVYDTLFAEAKNYNKYYNSSYGTAGLHRVGKLKI